MIDKNRIANKIISKFKEIGIDIEVSGQESHTAKLVREIVNAIINEITENAEVRINTVQTTGISSPAGVPESHTGYGIGDPGSIS